MAHYRAAILGCGGRGRAHAAGYAAAPNAEIVACADPVAENARSLADRYHVPRTYADYRVLLKEQQPGVVSICTWPHLHREMVEAAVAAGVRAIHCATQRTLRRPRTRRCCKPKRQRACALTHSIVAARIR